MSHDRLNLLREEILRAPAVAMLLDAVPDSVRQDLYLVGGALRDFCLGKKDVPDFDFVTSRNLEDLTRECAEKLSARRVVLDERWGVIRLVCNAQGLLEDRITLDFAAMQGADILEDLSRRDFTCNAMALSLTGEASGASGQGWWDPRGGLDDLRTRTIRAVQASSLREDPLRMLRAFRLGATLGFEIEADTLETICRESEGILQSAGERIHDELFRFLAAPDSHGYLIQMDRCGMLQVLFPEIERMKGLPQGRHHHLDVWGHSLQTARLLESTLRDGLGGFLTRWNASSLAWVEQQPRTRPLLKIAALFHDLGKPATRSLDPAGEVHFYGHDRASAEAAYGILERIRAARIDRERVKNWIRYHMAPVHMTSAYRKGHLTEKAMIRFLRRVGPDALGVLVLSLADVGASGGSGSEQDWKRSYFEVVDSLFSLCVERGATSREPGPLLSGRDLMDALNIDPGPRVGRLLRLLDDARIQGRIRDREGALDLARALHKTLRLR
jgi:poly(A) polymerase